MLSQGNISSIFSSNSEANASELPENLCFLATDSSAWIMIK